MGYLIIQRTYNNGDGSYILWIEDNYPIFREMSAWLNHGDTTEILEYVPDRHPHTDPLLIPQLNLWDDHLRGQANGI
jgi:hypothetical protein